MPYLAQAPTQPHFSDQSLTRRRSRWNNMAHRKRSIDVSKYIQFFPFYFTRNGKVCCLLVTTCDSFVIKRFKNKGCVVVFFSYWTKYESPAGDHFWKFSHQCSIFGRIGDQWVAISSPVESWKKCYFWLEHDDIKNEMFCSLCRLLRTKT